MNDTDQQRNKNFITRPFPAVQAAFLPAALVFVFLLFSCGGEEPAGKPGADPVEAGTPPAAVKPRPEPARAVAPQRREDDFVDGSSIKGRQRDGVVLAVADPLDPRIVRALPPGFPDDIPLGNWLSVGTVRLLGETDFVIECSTSYRRGAVGEFFSLHLPERGWKLVNKSSKPILSVLTFRKGERVLTVMVKKQGMNEDVGFDISYKKN